MHKLFNPARLPSLAVSHDGVRAYNGRLIREHTGRTNYKQPDVFG